MFSSRRARPLRIAHLSAGEIFTAKWANSQAADGCETHVITCDGVLAEFNPSVTRHKLLAPAPFGYYLDAWQLRCLLRRIDPDVLHVHYATGFGTLGRLAGFRPCVLSCLGSDIMIAPGRSAAMRRRLIRNLHHYDAVCITSYAMESPLRELAPSGVWNLSITPIGVDTTVFAPRNRPRDSRITVGTVKKMQPIYGIDLLIRSFAEARRRLLDRGRAEGAHMRLLIVGSGPSLKSYRELASQLGVREVTRFLGEIPNSRVPEALSEMDIFVALSRSESFGVAVLEAQACGLPVVVSGVGGLPEVVADRSSGFIVPPEDASGASAALERLVSNADLRRTFGEAGRKFVQTRYEWADCVEKMYSVYSHAIARSRELAPAIHSSSVAPRETRRSHSGEPW